MGRMSSKDYTCMLQPCYIWNSARFTPWTLWAPGRLSGKNPVRCTCMDNVRQSQIHHIATTSSQIALLSKLTSGIVDNH